MEAEKSKIERFTEADCHGDDIKKGVKIATKGYRSNKDINAFIKTVLRLRDSIKLKDGSVNTIIAMTVGDNLEKHDEDESKSKPMSIYRGFLQDVRSMGIKPASNYVGERVEVMSCFIQILENRDPEGQMFLEENISSKN